MLLQIINKFLLFQIIAKMNKEKQSQIDPSANPQPNLKLIYGYYCKLNNAKLKHKHFDDVNEKSVKMNLHQFMTFCKDFHIIAAHNKKNNNCNSLSNIAPAFQNIAQVQDHPSIINCTSLQKVSPMAKISTQQSRLQLDNMQNKAIFLETEQMGENIGSSQIEKSQKIRRKIPVIYCKERKLAELFKKYVDCQGQINFESFFKIVQTLSQQMFPNKNQQINKRQNINTNTNKGRAEGEKIVLNQIGKQISPFTQMMEYLRIETKESTLSTFQKINELHGTLQHLSMMRSPIKRLNLKNDPILKINQMEELKHTKIKNIQRKQLKKTDKQMSRLPKLSEKTLKQSYGMQSYNKKLKHFELQDFLQENKQKIEMLNNSYLRNNLKDHAVKQKILKKSRVAQQSKQLKGQTNPHVLQQSKNIKYGSQHQDIAKKQIGQLFDLTNLYDDDIFNKYIELNYNTDQAYQAKSLNRSRLT